MSASNALVWWIVMRFPDQRVWAWEIGDPKQSVKDDLVLRARAFAGFPPDDGWAYDKSLGYDLALTEEPHPKLGAVVRPLSELTDLPGTAAANYAAAYARAQHDARVEQAEKMLHGLDPAVIDELLTRRRAQPLQGKETR